MGTRKMLAACSLKSKRMPAGEFLVPLHVDGKAMFLGLKSGRVYQHGAVVYIGKEINAADVAVRLEAVRGRVSEAYIGSARLLLDSYLQLLEQYRIGNIVRIEAATTEGSCAFALVKIADSPHVDAVPLP